MSTEDSPQFTCLRLTRHSFTSFCQSYGLQQSPSAVRVWHSEVWPSQQTSEVANVRRHKGRDLVQDLRSTHDLSETESSINLPSSSTSGTSGRWSELHTTSYTTEMWLTLLLFQETDSGLCMTLVQATITVLCTVSALLRLHKTRIPSMYSSKGPGG